MKFIGDVGKIKRNKENNGNVGIHYPNSRLSLMTCISHFYPFLSTFGDKCGGDHEGYVSLISLHLSHRKNAKETRC